VLPPQPDKRPAGHISLISMRRLTASRCRITLATTATNPAIPATVPIIAPKIDTLLLFVLLVFLMLLISFQDGREFRPVLN
jgi:hypothetical protein